MTSLSNSLLDMSSSRMTRRARASISGGSAKLMTLDRLELLVFNPLAGRETRNGVHFPTVAQERDVRTENVLTEESNV